MAKIFFPYIDRPKEFPFLLGRRIRFLFIVEDLVYYWEFTMEGATLYLNSGDISKQTPILKDILLEDTGITFYLANDSLAVVTPLVQAVYIEFEQIGKGVHTLGRLDPLTLGDIDPFTLGDISNVSANWKALRNAIVTAVSNITAEGGDLRMRLNSEAVVATEKAIFTGELSSFTYMTGLRKQRGMTLGELDPHVLEDIDMMLTTFRVFEDVPASVVKIINVTHRKMLKNALAVNEPSANIYPNAGEITAALKNALTRNEPTADVYADARGIVEALKNDVPLAMGTYANATEVGFVLRDAWSAGKLDTGVYLNILETQALKGELAVSEPGAEKHVDAEGITPVLKNEEISAVGRIPNKASGAYMQLLSAGNGMSTLGIMVAPTAHKTALLSSNIAIEITTTTENT